MGLIQKQSILSTIASYVGVVIGYVNVIILYPAFFKPEQFGLTRVLIAMAFILTQFSQLGMRNVIVKLFPYFRNEERGHYGFLFLSMVLPLIGLSFFTIIILSLKTHLTSIYADQSPLVSDFFIYVIPMTLFMLYLEVFESYMRANHRITVPIIFREVLQRSLVTLAIFLFFYKLITFTQFIILFTSTYGLAVIALLGYVTSQKQLYLAPQLRPFKKRFLKIIFKYGSFSLLSGVAAILVNRIDIIMLSWLADLSNTAIYSIGFMIASVIQVPRRNMNKISVPVISQAWKDRNISKIDELYKYTSLNQLLIGILIFIGIWINIDDLFQWMPNGNIYKQGKTAALLIAFGRIIDMVAGANNQIILTSKYFRFHFYAMILLVFLTIATNYILIPRFGIEGAALATLISLLFFNLIKFIYLWLKFNMQPLTTQTIQLIGAGTLTLVIGLNIPSTDFPIFNIVYRSIIVVILYGSLILTFNISQDATNLFWQSLRWLGIKK